MASSFSLFRSTQHYVFQVSVNPDAFLVTQKHPHSIMHLFESTQGVYCI